MNTQPEFLQSYVVPVCLFEDRVSSIFAHSLVGTAFFINSSGVFLTASHVLEQAAAMAKARDQLVGLVVKIQVDGTTKNGVVLVDNFENAPAPHDIAIGKVPVVTSTHLTLETFDIDVWKDVATFGYPLSALGGEPEDFRINLRAHKGYIQRITKPQDMKIGRHPDGFELSFNISPGMSGSPIFIYRDGNDLVVGVSVSSFRGETTESEISEVLDDGRLFTEKRVRIEEYGFAHDIRGLLDWKPSLFGGRTLLELSKL
ncbi:serine protease [Agrobacterium sp. SOY23]|uniref:S1 family peptidase n=1 Tax=Agrobacterium sp. SOY23 TaxID=3014555 RepID=UPI0022AFB359|nr:serine protease [Agrobacterium sp. SOY23]MCZ4428869.1 serine protease [Agrobacterium sp. SOY23]